MSRTIIEILKSKGKFNEVAKIAFDCVDTDKSGLIDSSELEKIMVQIAIDMGADPPTKEDVYEVMEHLDEDKSGKIDFNEFKILIRDVLEAMLEDKEDQN
jgi:Ca2+-binding EF-hand superfamily protein